VCDEPGEAPDLIVGALDQVQGFGSVDGISAFAIGSTSCNIGTCWLDWFATTPRHPVFAQNLYRLSGGAFEQIGQSWVAHRFFALSSMACETGCVPTNGTHLGVHCSTSNSGNATGQQLSLGPKSEVRAVTGEIDYPYTSQGEAGSHVFKRLQVRQVDLDPAHNVGARYFVEGQSVAADDAAAGNRHNNVSYREVMVLPVGSEFNLSLVGDTQVSQPAILAWLSVDPDVVIETVDVPGDGRFYVGSRVTDLGDGLWRYEYAVHNLDSDRAARSVSVPVPSGANATGLGFHDVDYHSGEVYDGTDWPVEVDLEADPNVIRWTTDTFDLNPIGNALRWGTLYNFRFVVDVPPSAGALTLGLFEQGTPQTVSVPVTAPRLCDGDGDCEPGEGACNCPLDCGAPPTVELDCTNGLDDDCNGRSDCLDPGCCSEPGCPPVDSDGDTYLACEDCDDEVAAVWFPPDVVSGLTLQRVGPTLAVLSWDAPDEPGCVAVSYQVVRSTGATEFSGATCLDLNDPGARSAWDTTLPAPDDLFAYLVRATNGCPNGIGPLGPGSDGLPRPSTDCPLE
jgi:hypothetical protein